MFNQIPILRALKQDRWVKPFLVRYRKTLILAISLGILTFFCGGGLMFTAGYLISRSATKPENILLIYVPIVITRAFGVARPAVRYLERLVSHNWVFKMTSKFRQNLYDSLEQDAIVFNSKYQLGDILGLLSDDVSHIQNLYLRTIFPMFVACGLYAIIVVGLGLLSPLMGLWMLVLFGLIIFAIPLWTIIVNGARQEFEKKVQDYLYTDLTDNVLGVNDWILSGRSAEFLKVHVKDQTQLTKVRLAKRRFERWRDFLLQVLFLLAITSLIVWGSFYFGQKSTYYTNWIAAFALALFPTVEAFASLPAASQETNVYQDSLTRLNNLPTIKEQKSLKQKIKAPYNLIIKDVHYTYPNSNQEVLHGLSLDIKNQEKLAILGKSGSGKSTLAALLRGDRVATSGSIKLNGIATSEFGEEIANYFSVINQNPYLFNTTIANNLRLGDLNATPKQMWDVLERVGLKDMVENLDQGLETKVDEAGLRFSGGERHRLALARVLLKDSPIVLLDEPTVGLDPITEQKVIDTFMKELTNKTLIWITHHLQGIDQMDQIIFIENGKIAMQGSPEELWQTQARYRELKKADMGI